MKFGLFDHVDRSERSLAAQFDERLEYVAAADAAGFYCYHVAEHHATPLNMVPAPGVYLGAVARATKRIRLGPLVYLLPLYTPMRLVEEICMLDHLSHGRLDVGVGRGVSPYELNYARVDPQTSRDVFLDAFDALIAGLTHERLTHSGKFFTYANAPMELRPLQRPHPPIWYASSNEAGSRWGGERGLHYCTLGTVQRAKGDVRAFKEALARRGAPAIASPDFPGGAAVGIMRHAVIAETDQEALQIAKPAYAHFYASLTKLERESAAGPRVARSMQASVEEGMQTGSILVGAPATVQEVIRRQVEELGVNYMIFSFFFGTLTLAHALRSLRLFAREIMPALEPL